MTNLQKHLLELFKSEEGFVTFDNIPSPTFVKMVMSYFIVLVKANITAKSTVLITGKFSVAWAAAFIASIFKGCAIIIYPHGRELNDIPFYATRNSVQLIFTDDDYVNYIGTYNQFERMPFCDIIYNYESHYASSIKTNIANSFIGIDHILEKYNSLDVNDSLKYIEKISTPIQDAKIMMYASDNYKHPPVLLIHDHETVLNAIDNIERIFNFQTTDSINLHMNTPDKHYIVTVLLPLFSRTRINTTRSLYNTIKIFDNAQFLKIWRDYVTYRYYGSGFFLNKIIEFLNFKWLERKIKLSLLNDFLEDSKVIIMNADLPKEIIKTLAFREKTMIVYGTSETNYLTTFNDFSTKPMKEYRNGNTPLGTCFPNTELHHTGDDKICLVSDHLYKGYAGNIYNETPRIRKDLVEIKRHVLKIEVINHIPYVYFEGNNYLKHNNIWYDRLEIELRSLPLIKNAVFCDTWNEKGEMALVIVPDVHMADIERLGLPALTQKFSDLLGELNIQLRKTIAVQIIVLTDKTIFKTNEEDKPRYDIYRRY